MITRYGPQAWKNIHVTFKTQLEDLIDIDNTVPTGPQPTGFALLKKIADDVDGLIAEAAQKGKRIRALGSAWALSDITMTNGWLLNTKLLNGCFDVADTYFEPSYPPSDRTGVVIAQCGMSVAELNAHLEVTATSGFRRALKTAGIGAGQTIAGAVSGNTHGSAINFGAMSDFVVGLQLVTGGGQSLWIERASHPVLNDAFVQELNAVRIRNDDVFDAAVVSFGAFGVITAMALETLPAYHQEFPPVKDVSVAELKTALNGFATNVPADLYHYEFVFDPYSEKVMVAAATKKPYADGYPTPTPTWIVRDEHGYRWGDESPSTLINFPLLPPSMKTSLMYKEYRKKAVLGREIDGVSGTRGSPGQLFTATVFYGEGYTESAIGVSIKDAAKMFDISCSVIKAMDYPAISQVRLVKASRALFGFTQLTPITAVFEYGLLMDDKFPVFEKKVLDALRAANIPYTLHWSKNSGVQPAQVTEMYGTSKVAKWRAARKTVFNNDATRMHVFDNEHLERCGLAN